MEMIKYEIHCPVFSPTWGHLLGVDKTGSDYSEKTTPLKGAPCRSPSHFSLAFPSSALPGAEFYSLYPLAAKEQQAKMKIPEYFCIKKTSFP